MIDESVELIQKRVQQAIGLIERLKEENENLKNEITRMQDEIQKLKEEASSLREEREAIKGKIDVALSMLDDVELKEQEEETDKADEGDSPGD